MNDSTRPISLHQGLSFRTGRQAAAPSAEQNPSSPETDSVHAASQAIDNTVPEGGRGWIVIAACSVVAWWFVGTSYSWGIIQDALVVEGVGSPASLAFVGSLSTGLISALAIVNARVVRWLGARYTTLLGVTFLGLSALTSSAAVENLAGLFFTSGVLLGLGLG